MNLELNLKLISTTQSIASKIVKAFPNGNIKTKFFVLNGKTDFYFPRHKLAIEVDELGYLDKNEEDDIKDKIN